MDLRKSAGVLVVDDPFSPATAPVPLMIVLIDSVRLEINGVPVDEKKTRVGLMAEQ